jgi:histidinol-phosphate aminotransferase
MREKAENGAGVSGLPQAPEFIRVLKPYQPGKPIEETQREYGLKEVIKLASNENPLGPGPKAVAAITRELKELHRYPDASAYALKSALAEEFGVDPAEIVVGNGSNEIIDFLVRTYAREGDAIVTSQAAFVAYRLCAQIHGVRTLEAPLGPGLRFDLEAMLELCRKEEKARIVFLPNPNNPTGTYVTRSELRSFLKALSGVRGGRILVALDYAYWEYVTAADLPDPLDLWREFPNVVILKTFSKVHGLAGLRVGYAIGTRSIIEGLEKVRQPFNFNSLALTAARVALSDRAFVRKAVKLNTTERSRWEKRLRALGIPFWPSQGNFILIDAAKGLGASGLEVFERAIRKGVILRPVANYGLVDALRVSIGTRKENERALRVLAEVQQELRSPAAVPARPSQRKRR